MSFNPELTGDQLESLRGTASVAPSHSGRVYVSACPNTVIYSGRVNQSVFGTSFAQFDYDGGSGTLANVLVGQTVYVSHTNDIHVAFFTGRVRKAPTSSILYVNETSAPIEDNDYFWVVDDFRIWDKLGVFSSNTLKVDYDITFRELLPRITNLRSGYATFITGAAETYEFSPTVSAATAGAVISEYLWDVGDGTITVGSDTTREITVTFPPGFRWVHFFATDSGNRVAVRHFPVWVHDADNLPELLQTGDIEVSASLEDGYSGSLPAYAGVSDLLDNTLVMAWIDAEKYNGALEHIVNNTIIIGRFRNSQAQTTYDDAGQLDAAVRYEIEGPMQILNRLQISPVEILSDSTPTAFCQINSCTPWREIHFIMTELSTFHELHSVDFDIVDATYADLGVATPAGSILNAVKSIASTINAAPQMNSAGEMEIVRDAVFQSTTARSTLVTVADWTTADFLGIDGLEHDNVNVVGRMLGSGGSYNTTSRKIAAVDAIAPGLAQDYPDGAGTLDRQVLASNQTKAAAAIELNNRIGHAFAQAQGTDEFSLVMPDGYWWLTPARNLWHTWTLSGEETANGIVLSSSTRWQLASINAIHSLLTGAVEVRVSFRRETVGEPGQTIVYPPQSITPITVPEFPPLPSFPAFDIPDFFLPDDLLVDLMPPAMGGTLIANPKHDGSVLFVGTPAQAFVCPDGLSQLTPTWSEVTPELEPGEIITFGQLIQRPAPGAYLLTSGLEWTHTFDFTTSDGGWDIWHDPGSCDCDVGTYSAGFHTVFRDNGVSDQTRLVITYTGSTPSVLTSASLSFSWTKGFDEPPSPPHRLLNMGTSMFGGEVFSFFPENGTQTYNWTGSVPFTDLALDATAALVFPQDHTSPLGECVITRLTVGGSGSNPFTGDPPMSATGKFYYKENLFALDAEWVANDIPIPSASLFRVGQTESDVYLYDSSAGEAYYSDDRGATWSSAITVGTPPDEPGGFDTQRIGTVSLGAADAKVRIATTQGGSYSDYTTYPTDAIPTAIYIPRWKFSGATNGSGVSAPDYFTGSSIADSAAGHSLWKVTTGGGSVTQIDVRDDSAVLGLAINPNCLHIPWYSTAYQDLMGLFSFGGDIKLAVSVDAGANWEVTGTLDASACHLITRRTDTRRKQLWITNGVNLGYCSDYKTSPLILAVRIGPSSDTLLFVDVLA